MKLCKGIVPNPKPLFVCLLPESFAVRDECFDNVRQKIERDGGNIQYGWQIWEWSNIYIEAEFHAVWISPYQTYLDLTPKDEPEERILFLPDPNRRFEGKRIDNIRRPLRKDRLISDFLKVSEEIYKLKLRGQNPNNPKEFKVSADLYEKLSKHHLIRREMLKQGQTEDSLCFCGSSKKYKNCHSL